LKGTVDTFCRVPPRFGLFHTASNSTPNHNSKSPTVCPILSLKSKQHSYMPALPMPCFTVLLVTPHTPPFLRPPKAKKSYLMYKNGRKNIELLARPLDSGD